MMIWLISLFALEAFADSTLSSIQKLDQELPDQANLRIYEEKVSRKNRGYSPPVSPVSFDKILKSGTEMGAVAPGAVLRDLKTNESYKVTKLIYLKYFRLQDEFGFKYLQNKDGTVAWKVPDHYVTPLKDDISLHVTPRTYTPAGDVPKSFYDKGLSLPPEFSFYVGYSRGDFIKDLFDDKSGSGFSNQYGLHFFTNWKLPLKIGAVGHLEQTTYNLSNGGRVNYSSFSFGPQIKSRDFTIGDHPLRVQLQFRVGPLAKATAETQYGRGTFRFNSSDLLASIERPLKNHWGEFVVGFYFQNQWLNLKDQEVAVNLNSSNETNKSFGFSLSQVFQ